MRILASFFKKTIPRCLTLTDCGGSLNPTPCKMNCSGVQACTEELRNLSQILSLCASDQPNVFPQFTRTVFL